MKQREGMVGVNSREKVIEAVSELRTEHPLILRISRLRRVSDRYIRIGIRSNMQSAY